MAEPAEGKSKKAMKWYWVASIAVVVTLIAAYFYWGMNVISSKSQVMYDTTTGKPIAAGSAIYNPQTGALMTT